MGGMYANNTSVSVEKSRAEIEAVLGRYGAESFAYATDPGRAVVGFTIRDTTGTRLAIKMTLPLPDKSERRFTTYRNGSRTFQRDPAQAMKQWEQACRSSWRSLCLVIKAKLEACAAGISTIEREFLADIVLPQGGTVGEWLSPELKSISESGRVPRLMLAGGGS